MNLHTTKHTELYNYEQQETGIRSESHIIGERSRDTRFVIKQIISNRAQLPFFRRNFQHTTKKSKIWADRSTKHEYQSLHDGTAIETGETAIGPPKKEQYELIDKLASLNILKVQVLVGGPSAPRRQWDSDEKLTENQ